MSTISSASTKYPLDGSEYVPLSGAPKKKGAISAIKDYILSFFSNKTTLDLLTVADSNLQYNAIDVNLGLRKTTQSSKSSDFSVSLGTNPMLLWVYVHRGSNPLLFKIGTTAGDDDILESQTISTFGTFPFMVVLSGDTTIYFTISSGDGDFEIMFIKSFHI